MTKLIPTYIGQLRRRTNAQLLAWQGFSFIKYASAIAVMLWMARCVTDVAIIKQYEELILIGSTCSFFFVSGLGQTALPFFESETSSSEEQKRTFKSLFILLFFLGLIASAIILLYAYLAHFNSFSIYALFALATALNIPSFSLESYYLAYKKQVTLFGWGTVSYACQIAFLIGPILIWNSLFAGIIGYTTAASLRFIYAVFQLQVFNRNAFNFDQISRLFVFASPVIVSFLIGNSYLYINSFIVEEQLNNQAFILYRYGAKEFPLFLIIANSFSLIYSAKISNAHANQELSDALHTYKMKTKKVMHQLFPFAIILTLSSKMLFQVFYGNYFTDAYRVFNLLMLLLLSRVLFPQTILFGLKKTKHFLFASGVELIVGLFLSLLLIQHYQLIGVCIAIVIASLVEKIYLIVICYRESVPFFNHFPSPLYVLYSSFLLACTFASFFLF